MKKVALLTINGNSNYGNKLQHFGLQYFLEKKGVKVETIKTHENIKVKLYNVKKRVTNKNYRNRYSAFINFDKKIKYSKLNMYKKYDYYVIGSDQVWNINFKTFSKSLLLDGVESQNKISYASSFGISNLPEKYSDLFYKNLIEFKAISVREDKGKEIVEKLTSRKDVEVVIDPTMLLTAREWDEVSAKPSQLDKISKDKFILNYFLGSLSKNRKEEIEKIAKLNNCHIINILDENDPFYTCGPSEFLYLEKNAFLICTDSFHSSVFAVLYNRPFIIFDREEKGVESMNSRVETLISKFKLKNRKYNGILISKENLNHDYKEAYKILENERKKANLFLEKALDIEENNNED